MRRAFLVDEGRRDAIFDQRWLVFHGFVSDGVKFVIGHHLQEIGHQLILRS